ncbi:MAG: magnesium transporter [Candidatus Handelsmanbacteria bacterium]|nr:magnesium transporter [Candidatus Handelsmanbacteria bacterium]
MSEESSSQDEIMEIGSLQGRREILLHTARESLEAGDLATLRLVLNNQHPADLADLFRHLGNEDQQRLLPLIAKPLAARMLAELDTSSLLNVAESLDHEVLSDLVEEMAPDDAADILGDLPKEHSERVLELMEGEEVAEVRELMSHPEDTGGGLMTSCLVAVQEDMDVASAIAHLRELTDEEHIFYVYVVDEGERLLGTAPIKRLLLASQDTLISELTKRECISVRADMDQEEIARLFADYDLVALPVVDGEGRLVGQVTVDDVVDVINREATEDIYGLAGTSATELEARSIAGVLRRRLPWLLFCLGGSIFSGAVIDGFHQEIVAASSMLLIFMPGIAGMGGNTGVQTSTVTVRSLATGHIKARALWSNIWRELRVAMSIGLILGVLILGVARLWTGQWLLGGCVGLAMFSSITLASLLGALLPFLFRRVGVDPAVASGPLITTLNDGLSLLVYFTIALTLFHLWG